LSFPAAEGDRELSPSPVFGGMGISSPSESSPPARTWYDVLRGSTTEIFEETNWSPLPAESARGGASLLELQAACPFHAFGELRLNARRFELPLDGVAPVTRGKLVHAAMKRVWDELRSYERLHALGSAEIHDLLDRSIDAALQESTDAFSSGEMQRALAEVERDRLHRLIAEWLDEERKRSAFEVLTTEEKQEVEIGGLRMSIRRDRTDKLADGRTVIIDYKTSKLTGKSWEGDRPDAPQLPLYAVTNAESKLAAVAFAQLRAGNLRFVGLQEGRDVIPRAEFVSSMDIQIATWRIVLEDLAREFRAGYAAVDPKNNEKTCRNCGLHSLCRIAERASEKANA
jgi:ATP-dependent helicase/nuclease subunit B